MKFILALTLLFFGMSFTPSGKLSAHVERTYFLKGNVGDRQIILKMLCYDEMPTRHIYYFFQDDKRDRYLTGKIKEKFWNFIADEKDKKSLLKSDGTLHIGENANGIWTGWWIDSLGRDWDIVLRPIKPDSISSQFSYLLYTRELDPYEQNRLSNIHFLRIKTEKLINDLAGDWYIEKESGISFFRIRSNNNRLNTDSINASLETIHLSLIQKYFGYNPEKIDTKVETSVPYLSNELVSFKIASTSTLKTHNTLQTRQLYTFYIRSGEQVNLEDLIWFDKGETKPSLSDLYTIYKYRKNVFAPKIFNLLHELYPDRMQLDSCDINKMETWALPVWNLTSKGIAFGFATSIGCDVLSWAIIPYEKLKPFMGKKYRLLAKR